MKGKILQVLCVAGLFASVSFLTVGCAKKPVESQEDARITTDTTTTADSGASVADTADTADTAGSYESIDSDESVTATTGAYEVTEGRTHKGMLPVYFDFDKSNIRDDQQPRIEGNAEFIKSNSDLKISIQGNCDERGTNEYNIALGERRAQAAKKYLVNLGVDADKLYTVSFGEERPLLLGHDEYSWSQNRRDDFVIQ
ncbi:MAG: peptidoglycan-associated lipoprotein Pal [Desulfobacteraceae bacterium]